MMKFANETDFVQFLIERADHSPNVIVGMGVHSPTDCDGWVITGSGSHTIHGYFYTHEKGFYDHFVIEHSYGNLATAESHLKSIRTVTDQFYYH